MSSDPCGSTCCYVTLSAGSADTTRYCPTVEKNVDVPLLFLTPSYSTILVKDIKVSIQLDTFKNTVEFRE